MQTYLMSNLKKHALIRASHFEESGQFNVAGRVFMWKNFLFPTFYGILHIVYIYGGKTVSGLWGRDARDEDESAPDHA